eukprot:2222646-Pleurochrysis_carterae.AAC.1
MHLANNWSSNSIFDASQTEVPCRKPSFNHNVRLVGSYSEPYTSIYRDICVYASERGDIHANIHLFEFASKPATDSYFRCVPRRPHSG